jgi:hypothetical protein
MLLSWFEDDLASERSGHGWLADGVAIAACLAAALLLFHHAPANGPTPRHPAHARAS